MKRIISVLALFALAADVSFETRVKETRNRLYHLQQLTKETRSQLEVLQLQCTHPRKEQVEEWLGEAGSIYWDKCEVCGKDITPQPKRDFPYQKAPVGY